MEASVRVILWINPEHLGWVSHINRAVQHHWHQADRLVPPVINGVPIELNAVHGQVVVDAPKGSG